MIKLYVDLDSLKNEMTNPFWFVDLENDIVYEIDRNTLVATDELVSENFKVVNGEIASEGMEERQFEEFFNVEYIVDEKNTYAIKEQIKADGGKWDGMCWTVPGPSDKYKTKMYISKK